MTDDIIGKKSFLDTYIEIGKPFAEALRNNTTPEQREWQIIENEFDDRQQSKIAIDMATQYSEFGDAPSFNIILESYFEYLYKTYSMSKKELNVMYVVLRAIFQHGVKNDVNVSKYFDDISDAMLRYGLSTDAIATIYKMAHLKLNITNTDEIITTTSESVSHIKNNIINFPFKRPDD